MEPGRNPPTHLGYGRRVSDAEHESEHDPGHQVTPLELLFDLTFVFAMTQVTVLLADDPTWGGVLRGMLVLGPARLTRSQGWVGRATPPKSRLQTVNA